ncbi:MAG TPA: YraN family protein [Thermoanaerobaculia bacterium]|nr:YraN family protein [Thermoanaerobaculia bacterium]
MMPLSWARRIAARLRGLPARPAGSRGAGYDWERTAEKALGAEGYRILARNFRTRRGEIDFVAEDNGVLCFVEVKGRSGRGFGPPAAAVTAEKQRRIIRAAEIYLRRRRGRRPVCRFDVVSILEEEAREPEIEILRDAFRGPTGRGRKR